MKVLINFADKKFLNKQRQNSLSAKWFGGFDKVIEYSPTDIEKEFLDSNKKIFEQGRGFGYWLWKPYFIQKALEQVNDGDYIFYCDSGSVFINSIDYLIAEMKESNQDVMLFETPLIEFEWTNHYVFEKLNATSDKYRLTNQILATFILIKKSQQSVQFINKYLELCCDELLLTDIYTKKDKCNIDHRHDQSILSVLAKKLGIIPSKDPSDYGKFPQRYLSTNRLFRINKSDDSYPVVILSNRKQNYLIYGIKYFLRCLISKRNY
ncbi:hypothetical protein AB6T38_09640 [Aliiglaciecola sp. SL4]|uniref:hypothetical protein n=1 Tax=Aliiglaciecola sp. SL4 TaxID=3239806 RepID=UPI00355B1603